MACVHIYCGDGKGKTSASVGLAVRAAGQKQKVLIARFLKNDNSGEVSTLSSVAGITLVPCERTFGFTWKMSEEVKKEAALYYGQLFEKVCGMAEAGEYDLLVLDELLGACGSGMVEEAAVAEYLKRRPDGLEVVLTGRNPSAQLLELADYVSEIRKIKHPYDHGVGARKGIEY